VWNSDETMDGESGAIVTSDKKRMLHGVKQIIQMGYTLTVKFYPLEK